MQFTCVKLIKTFDKFLFGMFLSVKKNSFFAGLNKPSSSHNYYDEF